MTEYFYRKMGSADFEASDVERILLPIRFKNVYVQRSQFFDSEAKQWTDYNGNFEALAGENLKLLPVEYADQPFSVSKPVCPYDSVNRLLKKKESYSFIEKYNVSHMKEYLVFRFAKERRDFAALNYLDSNSFDKDHVCVRLDIDEEKLTMKITSMYFERGKTEENKIPEVGIPSLKEKSVFFDVLNGTAEAVLEQELLNEYSDYEKTVRAMHYFFSNELPENVKTPILKRLLKLMHLYTNISYESLCERYSQYESELLAEELVLLSILPYEPALYKVLMKQTTERKFEFDYRRDAPEVFKHYCKYFKIKNTKTVRRCFAKRPDTLRTYLRLKDCGFRDINLYNRVLENDSNCELIDEMDKAALTFFARYSIRKRGQRATLNTLLKVNGIEDKDTGDFLDSTNFVFDGMRMFQKYFKNIPSSLKLDILYDGFTKYNHDALAGVSYHCRHKKSLSLILKNRKICVILQ